MEISVATMQDGNGLQAVEQTRHRITEYSIQYCRVRNLIQLLGMLESGFQKSQIFLNESIHAPWELSEAQLQSYGVTLGKTYPEPIVNHEFARKRALETFDTIAPKK